MTDRTVSVRMVALVDSYMARMSAAGKATTDLANKVDQAKGRSREGFQMMGRAALLGGGAVVAGFGFAAKSAADFDAKMALVKTLSKATSAEMGQLHDAALTVGQAYGFTADQVADAEAELVKAGISVKDIMGGALTGALTLAAAGQTDVAEATETAAVAMTQFNLSGKDVPHIADLLAAGADKALGSVGDLSYALASGGLVASQFGMTVDDTVGSLAAFAQAGLIGERGGTVLRQMLLQLTAPSAQAGQLMKNLGIHTYDAAGQFVGITGLAGQLHNKLGELTQAQRDNALAVIFGSRAIQGANVLYTEGAKGIQEWIDRVNDAGFAELQAAGKMDSLTGDVTKLHSALQAAFIGTGEDATGPLRELVQDTTKVVNVWLGLPGPVKAGAEALLLAGGAVTFLGGAAVLFIPKWAAMNAALAETRVGAISARGALLSVGKVTVATAALIGVAEATKALDRALAPTAPDVDKLTQSLVELGRTGKPATDALFKAFGDDLKNFDDELKQALDPGAPGSWWNRNNPVTQIRRALGDDNTGLDDLEKAQGDFKSLDEALAGLVEGGNAKEAAKAYGILSDKAREAGYTSADLAKVLPGYSKALSESAASAEVAGNGIDKFGNAVGDTAQQLKNATDALKNYKNQLHAMADPLFAMNSALGDLHDKQKAADKAIREHGANSKATRQANLDLASSVLDVKAAAADLATAVGTGDVKLSDARKTLRGWVDDGLLTRRQADDVTAAFERLISRADRLSDLHPHVTVTADTSQVEHAINQVKFWLSQLHDKSLSVTVRHNVLETGPGTQTRVPLPRAGGGAVHGEGSGTSDSIAARLSNREFVVRSDGSNLDAAIRFYGSMVTASPAGRMSSTSSRHVTYSVVNHYPEPERASDSVPRVLREVAFVSGNAW